MSLVTFLNHGHQVIVDAIAGLSEAEWHMEGVCGIWSVKDIVAHLAAIEHFKEEFQRTLLGEQIPIPYVELGAKLGVEGFNTRQTEIRRHLPYREVQAEFVQAFVNNSFRSSPASRTHCCISREHAPFILRAIRWQILSSTTTVIAVNMQRKLPASANLSWHITRLVLPAHLAKRPP
jgi:hypothetical protein